MKWQDIRTQYPEKWVLAEAIEAYTTEDNQRIVKRWAVIDIFSDFYQAMALYKEVHRQAPQREMYVAHTDSEEVHIKEQYWAGIRGGV